MPLCEGPRMLQDDDGLAYECDQSQQRRHRPWRDNRPTTSRRRRITDYRHSSPRSAVYHPPPPSNNPAYIKASRNRRRDRVSRTAAVFALISKYRATSIFFRSKYRYFDRRLWAIAQYCYNDRWRWFPVNDFLISFFLVPRQRSDIWTNFDTY